MVASIGGGASRGVAAKPFWLSQCREVAVAVVAGLLAQVAADVKGDIGPFQLAIALTVLALVLILRWRRTTVRT